MASAITSLVAEEALRLEEYFEQAGPEVRKLAAGFKAMRWGPEEIEAFVQTARMTRSSLTKSGAASSLMNELVEAKKAVGVDVDYEGLRKSGVHVTSMHVELSTEQQQFLRDDLAGVTMLQFLPAGRGERVKHAVAHAMNAIMDVQLYRKVPKGAVVMEVGANLRAAVRRGHDVGKYVAIKPALDAKDLQRYHSEMRAIKVSLRRTGRYALKEHQAKLAAALLEDKGDIVVRKKIQEADVAADYILSLQSNWDIPVFQLPAIMYNCGAKVWYMVMNRISGLNFYSGKRRGKEVGLDIVWEADADADVVSFWFEGDSSLAYKHKLSVVREYQNVVVREFECNGRLYILSETDMSTRSQLVLSCVDMGGRSVRESSVRYDCSVTGLESMVEITVPVLRSGLRKGERRVYGKETFMVGSESFSRVLQERVIAGAGGSVDTVISFARSNRVSVVYNGVRVSVDNPVAVNHFRQFAVAVDALACDILRSGEVDVAAIVKDLAGGKCAMRSPAAFLGAATGVSAGASSLVDAVVGRVRKLIEQSEESVAVSVQAASGIVKTLRPPRVKVEAYGQRREVHRDCYCEEKRELSRIIEGECGGLTEREEQALVYYQSVLNGKECTVCTGVRAVLEREYEQDLEASEEFFDCSDGDSDGDSGYQSAEQEKKDESSDCSSGSDGSGDEGVVRNSVGRVIVDEVAVTSEEDVDPLPLVREEGVLKEYERMIGAIDTAEAGSKTRMRLAAEEYVQVLRLRSRAVEDDLRQKWLIASMAGSHSQETLDAVSDEYCWYSYVDIAPGGRVIRALRDGVSVGGFQRVYDYQRDEFFPVEQRAGAYYVDPIVSSRVCTSGKMKIWNQPKLIERSLQLLRPGGFLDGPEVRLQFVNGVFGCGKTRGIKQSYVKQVARPGQRLVLTSSTKAAEQLREELFGSADSRVGRKYVRTYDSVLMHGVEAWFEEVAMDELAALSMGQAVLILAYLQPEKARAYGDFYQMEPKPFCDWEFQYPTVEPLCEMAYMSMSHRVRLSVMASSVKLYPSEAKLAVCNCCENVKESEEGGPVYQKITSVAQVPVVQDAYYFTAGQGDARAVREYLRATGGFPKGEIDKRVCTYAESQGMTVNKAICVRLERRTKPNSIHHEKKRINVGKSRAKENVEYYTCSEERDEMVKASVDASDESLRAIVRSNSREKWEEIRKAGGVDAAFSGFFDMKEVVYMY